MNFQLLEQRDLFLNLPANFWTSNKRSTLTIQKNTDSYQFKVESAAPSETIISTFRHFKEIIGEQRLQSICARPEIGVDIQKIDQNNLALTNKVLKKILLGILDIQKEDLDRIDNYQSISDKISQLLPFRNFEETQEFMKNFMPSMGNYKIDRAMTAGKGLKGFSERIYFLMHHHFQLDHHKTIEEKTICDTEFLCSRLADREMKKGNIVHLSDGYFYVDEVFIGKGAYVVVLCDLEGKQAPKIICRGTSPRPKATGAFYSLINDFQFEIGIMGVKQIWPALSNYLQTRGFSSVCLLGKSLGGAQAQELAILIEGVLSVKVEKLTTFASVGVGEKINQLFQQEILAKRTEENPFQIHIIRHGGSNTQKIDFVPLVGGIHLGYNSERSQSSVHLTYILSGQENVDVLKEKLNFVFLIFNLLSSFLYAHCRQATLTEFKWENIVDIKLINNQLTFDNRLEKMRKFLMTFIHFLTFSLLNKTSFNQFYENKKKLMATVAQEV